MGFIIYGTVERTLIVVKGIKSNNFESVLVESKELADDVKVIVKKLQSSLKVQNKELEKTSKQKASLKKTKEILETTVENLDLAKLSKTNIDIQSLTYKEKEIQEKINEISSQIESYTSSLKVEGGK